MSRFSALDDETEELRGRYAALPDPLAQDDGPEVGYGTAIFNELAKSYGFKRTDTGEMEWSIGNIVNAFKEDPFWTTLDYVMLIPGLGTTVGAAAKVSKGSSAVGKAYKAGELSLGQAISAQKTMPLFEGAVGRHITNPGRFTLDSDWARAVEKYGGDPNELWGLQQAYKNDLAATTQTIRADRGRLLGQIDQADMSGEDASRFAQMLHDPEFATGAAGELSGEAAEAYQKTALWRNQIHDDSFDLGLISRETHEANLGSWNKRVYEEYLNADERAQLGAGLLKNEGRASFLARMPEDVREQLLRDGHLHEVFSPEMSVDAMAKAATTIAGQRYAQGLAGSAIAKSGDELLSYMGSHANTPKRVRDAMGLSDDVMDALAERGDLLASMDNEDLFAAAGWVPLKKALLDLPDSNYVDEIAHHFDGKYVQRDALEGLAHTAEMFSPRAGFVGGMRKLAEAAAGLPGMGVFRGAKTVLNPPTWGRNWMGNVFNFIGAGERPTFWPGAAFRSLRARDEVWREGVEEGILDGSTWADENVRRVFDKLGEEMAAIEGKAGSSHQAWATGLVGKLHPAWGAALDKGVMKAEDGYAAIDQLWKLELYNRKKARYMKSLAGELDGEDLERAARARAKLDVVKYTPTFNRSSELTKWMRGVIPFSSFTTEQTRVWKNVMADKPHMFFAVAHMNDVLSQLSGAAAGVSPEELEEARKRLPNFTEGRHMTLLPMKLDGKLQFLDTSYMLPMANLGSDMAQAENLFFGAMFDPSSNPIFNIAAAASTGVDPFTKREVQPRFTERQLGIPVENEFARRAVGLFEHSVATLTPPLAPVGFGGTNLIEMVRQQRHPVSGQLLEPDPVKTIGANLFGLRTYESSVASQLQNVRYEEREIQQAIGRWRSRWSAAKANGDPQAMAEAIEHVRRLRSELEPEDVEKYIERMIRNAEPGKYSRVSTRQLEKTIERAEQIGHLSEEDKQVLAELTARYQSRRK